MSEKQDEKQAEPVPIQQLAAEVRETLDAAIRHRLNELQRAEPDAKYFVDRELNMLNILRKQQAIIDFILEQYGKPLWIVNAVDDD